jgi:hypothetical protein
LLLSRIYREIKLIVKDNNKRASESTHWYDRVTGQPCYYTKAKAGHMRNTTLADARKNNYVPSVSGIIKVANSEGLNVWKLNQMLLACLTLPRLPSEPEEAFIERVQHDSRQTAKTAAERGTAIHASCEAHMEGIAEVQHPNHARAVQKALNEYFGERPWEAERSFAKDGFGGKCDLVDFLDNGIVADIKTKEFTDPEKVLAYDEHLMQLSAYRQGFNLPRARCINIFVSVQEPVLIKIHEWRDEDLQRGWAMFQALLRYWQLKNKYE